MPGRSKPREVDEGRDVHRAANDASAVGRIRARGELVTQQRPRVEEVRPITAAVGELQRGVTDLTEATTELIQRLEPLLTAPGPEGKGETPRVHVTQFSGLLFDVVDRVGRNTTCVRELLERLSI